MWNDDGEFIFQNRLELIKQSTCGLQFLHHNKIIHRDFKPANLLVTGSISSIRVKIADFDDFSLIKDTIKTTTTISKKLVGFTLAYLAEELCLQSGCKPSIESDMFSWALTCYQILAGLPTPWSNVVPLLNDVLLLEAYKKKVRPLFSDIMSKYADPSTKTLCFLISKTWESEPCKRLTSNEVFFSDSFLINKRLPKNVNPAST